MAFRHIFYLEDNMIRNYQRSYLVYKLLKKRYQYVLDKQIKQNDRKKGDKIWTCWFQGIENAPEVCQVCVKRMKQIFGEDKVIVITADNYMDYVDIPEYIVDKWKKGIIVYAHFSDILRLCLLVQHGGTWIDSTILLLRKNIPSYFYDSPLFVFADHISGLRPNIQNSYLSAYSNSRILTCVRNLLFEYWKKENYVINYSIFHLFFQMAEEKYADEWKEVYRYPNHSTHILRKELGRVFDKQRYEAIKDACVIQKLTYKKDFSSFEAGSFYDEIIVKGNID